MKILNHTQIEVCEFSSACSSPSKKRKNFCCSGSREEKLRRCVVFYALDHLFRHKENSELEDSSISS